ncbi:LysR family transcriptional regulator [Nordella sp. HKS 07]|uniref:LysR substrate-binding domain-containing protein n=1 Tax=Nordella sp. HKS 07 TaxID=2712222 RepID=UPI0013E1BF93|nr:LysR substrate-binding domain-containing protein [Nordella sp. HKS 07]QIG47335.1 LysR family transcriptional regulator [Nordella sp. HKS 07]
MALSIKQVRYFLAAANAGQVSQAAIELNVSQSAVTAAIKQLEEDLSVRLFVRLPTGVALTAEGTRFLQHARIIMAAVNEAISAPLTEDMAHAGHIRVGVTYTVAGYFMPRHYARFLRNYPRISVELRELPREAIERGLVDRTLDIAVMLVSNLADTARIASETLLRSRRRLWLPVEHPLLNSENITLADVAREPYVMLTVDEAMDTAGKYWAKAGLEPRMLVITSSVEAVRSMVAAGMGVTVLSDMVYRPWSLEGQRIETRNVIGDIPSMDVGLAWNRAVQQDPATRVFHDFMSMTFSGAAAV